MLLGHSAANTFAARMPIGHSAASTSGVVMHIGHSAAYTFEVRMRGGHSADNTYVVRMRAGHFVANSFEVSMRIGRSGRPRVFFYDGAPDPSNVPTAGRPARRRSLRHGPGSSYVLTTGGCL